jgi:hypothetical protein
MSSLKVFRALAVSCILAATSLFSNSQLSSTGTVVGIVTDPGGSPVSTATITLPGLDGPVHSASTSEDGSFLLRELPSGTYTLKIASPGFAVYEQPTVNVAVGRTTRLSIRIALATAQQTVNVNAAQYDRRTINPALWHFWPVLPFIESASYRIDEVWKSPTPPPPLITAPRGSYAKVVLAAAR